MPDDTLPSTTLPLFTPIEQQVHPHMQDAQRAAINRALTLLSLDQQSRMSNIETMQIPRIAGVGQTAEAVTYPDNSKIYINTNADVYGKAQHGNADAIKKLASVLVHEQQHITNGSDELSAYDKQLAILRQLGASPDTIAQVQTSRAFVTGKDRENSGRR